MKMENRCGIQGLWGRDEEKKGRQHDYSSSSFCKNNKTRYIAGMRSETIIY
jgi:hypothetical protein